MSDRSARREVRNPVLALPAAQEIMAMGPMIPKAKLRELFRQLKAQCRAKEGESYRRRKGPMTSYYMAAGTYAGHVASVLKDQAQ